jgi:Pyridoxamine 5'-phosphate oxidase
VELGGGAAEEIAQLLDHHGQDRRLAAVISSHYGGLGLWQDGCFLFSSGSNSRKARNLARNPRCVVCTEDAHEAVIVEGTAEIADVAARRKLLPAYERKYKWDMSSMKDDILSMKEPVYTVRPRAVFGLWEKKFMGSATRWKFE